MKPAVVSGYDPPRNRMQMRLDSLLPAAVRPGSEAWRWTALLARSVRVSLGVGLAVAVTGLAAIGTALMLDGLGFLQLDIPQPASEALAVGLAAMMLGGALLGMAVEGSFRTTSRRPDAEPWETLVTYVPAMAATLGVIELIEGWAARLLPRFSDLFALLASCLDAVGSRGLTAGAAGLALMWAALQFGAPRYPFLGENAPALLYICWTAAVILTHRPPAL